MQSSSLALREYGFHLIQTSAMFCDARCATQGGLVHSLAAYSYGPRRKR